MDKEVFFQDEQTEALIFFKKALDKKQPWNGNGNNKNVTRIPIGKADGSLTIPVQSRPHSYILAKAVYVATSTAQLPGGLFSPSDN